MVTRAWLKLVAVIAVGMIVLTLFVWQADANADEVPVFRTGCVQMLGYSTSLGEGHFLDWVYSEHTRWAYWRVHDWNTGWYGPWIQMWRPGAPNWWEGSGGFDKNYWIDLQYAIGSYAGWRYGKIGGVDAYLASGTVCS